MKKLYFPSGLATALPKLTILCLFFASPLFAQNKGRISGSLLDEKSKALPFANVLLLKAKDSTLAKAIFSDESGKFLFEQITDNQYFISVSMVGYQKYSSPKFIISAENPFVDLPSIQMNLVSKALGEVTVSAKKPFIEQKLDKLVVNVENSIVATGNTVLEVLQKSPGITVDNNDNISIKGKRGVQIYMDGKPTYLSQNDLSNLLKNMTSEQIEKIEIITNPSSRYDAAGNSGIINIITKKDKNFGTNGSISGGYAASLMPWDFQTGLSKSSGFKEVETIKTGFLPKFNTSLSLNNRTKKINTYGNLNFSDRDRFQNNAYFRTIDGQIIEQYSLELTNSKNFGYKAGIDYYISKKTTFGFMVNGNVGKYAQNQPSSNNSYFKDANGTVSLIPKTISNGINEWKSAIFNTNLKHTFDSTGKELTIDFDFSIYNNLNKELGMTTRFFTPENIEFGNPLFVTSNIPNKYNIAAAKLDYILPLLKVKAKLEFGAKSSLVKSDNNILFFKNEKVDIGRTNHFIYTENINAIYTNFSKEINDKWSIQAGLRAEYWKAKGNSLTLNEIRTREQLQLFPTFFLSQKLNKDHSLNYSYSRRIERPDYESLNPFIYFLDPFTFQIGNEYLRPQFANTFEFTHTFKEAIVTTLGYSYTTDMMLEVIKNAKDDPAFLEQIIKYSLEKEVDATKITFATKDNLKRFSNYSLNISFPVPVMKAWMMNNNVTTYYNIYEGILLDKPFKAGAFAYNLFSSHSITLKGGFTGEVSGWYNSRNVMGQFMGKPQGAVNLGLQRTMWQKRGTLKLSVNDVFLTSYWNGEATFGGVNIAVKNRWDSRQVRLNFNYKFGNQQVKAARRRSTATESEQSRVKSGG